MTGQERKHPPHPPEKRDESSGLQESAGAQASGRADASGQEEASLVVRTAAYSGPLPPASEFARYESVLPGAADRILAMAEKEQEFQIEQARRALEHECRNRDRGQWFGFVSLLAVLGCGFGLAWLGAYKIAGTLFAVAIGAVLAAFILGRDGWRARPETETKDGEEK